MIRHNGDRFLHCAAGVVENVLTPYVVLLYVTMVTTDAADDTDSLTFIPQLITEVL